MRYYSEHRDEVVARLKIWMGTMGLDMDDLGHGNANLEDLSNESIVSLSESADEDAFRMRQSGVTSIPWEDGIAGKLNAMKRSQVAVLTMSGDCFDASFCQTLGLAMMLDKPILLCVARGSTVTSGALASAAAEILEFDESPDGMHDLRNRIVEASRRIAGEG